MHITIMAGGRCCMLEKSKNEHISVTSRLVCPADALFLPLVAFLQPLHRLTFVQRNAFGVIGAVHPRCLAHGSHLEHCQLSTVALEMRWYQEIYMQLISAH